MSTGSRSILESEIASLRLNPSRLEAAWLLGATLATITGKNEARLRLGRFVLRREIGRGGQGSVWEADDPLMERTVAVKLAADPTGVTDEHIRAEAQAMARLVHPNVAQVFDVGSFEGQRYIVMEHIQGEDLSTWLAAGPPRSAMLAMFIAAGRGLAAAHAAGITHGDFKPSNVMVSSEGEAKILDFGLARDGLGSSSIPEEAKARGGTLRYAAPEQRRGAPADALCDQFSFCTSLYEALFGALPHEPRRPVAGRPATRDELTRRVDPVLQRGLRSAPADRWPSMDALLAALEARPSVWRRAVPLSVVTLCALAGFGAALFGPRSEKVDECARAELQMAEVWSPARQDALAQAFADATRDELNPVRGVRAWARTRSSLTEQARAWEAAYGAACGDEVRARAIRACLRDQLGRFDVWLDAWRHADAQAVERAGEGAAAILTPHDCSNAVLRPADAEDEVVDALLARSDALRRMGRRDDAQQLAQQAVTRASEGGMDVARAEALLSYGNLLRFSEPHQAAQELEQAMLIATANGSDRLAAEIAAELAFVFASLLQDAQAARRTLRVAEAALARYGGDTRLEASLEGVRSDLAYNEGDYPQAIAILDRMLEVLEASEQPRPLLLVRLLHNRARARIATEDPELIRAALIDLRQVLEYERVVHGPDHPLLAESLSTQGNAQLALGQRQSADESWREALEIAEAGVDPDDRILAVLHNNLSLVALSRDEHEEALGHLIRAYEIRRASLGSEHPDTALVADNIGVLAFERGDIEQSLDWREEALHVFEQTLGVEHPYVAQTEQAVAELLILLSEQLLERGLVSRARKALERAAGMGPASIREDARTRLARLTD